MKTIETTTQDISQAIRELAPWYHNVYLPDGAQTRPDHPQGDFPKVLWDDIRPNIPDDLTGWRVLDIGCNAGFFSFALAKRGADVLGLDIDERYLRQANWLRSVFGLEDRVRFERKGVYDLPLIDEQFDLVWFTGVLYHLRYPLLGLDLVAQRTTRMLVIQSLMMLGRDVIDPPDNLPLNERTAMQESGWPKMAFIERRIADDPTNWWAPNHACMAAMLRSSGMRIIKTIPPETYICEPSRGVADAAVDDTALAANAARRVWVGDGSGS